MIRILRTVILAGLLAGCASDDLVKEAFNTDDPDLRRRGIAALSERDDGLEGKYLKAYALLAEDPDPLVRAAAVGALGRACDAAYLDVVVAALSDKDLQVRLDAAEALESIRGAAAVEPLTLLATSDADSDLRMRCCKTLRVYRTRPALNALLRGLGDADYGVRYAARCSLVELTGEDCAYDVGRWRRTVAAKDDPFAPEEEPAKSFWSRLGL